jgi:class 3 adenylate cyclase/CheY-like chemotaxis protein
MDSTKLRALIIDDDIFIKNLLSDMIEFNFPEVEIIDTAGNGKEGIEKILMLKPDMIFLDVEMPDMTGLEMLGQFEEPSFQTVFITSYNDYAVKALRMNALDYLVKPIKLEELTQAINKCKAKVTNKDRNETIKQTLNNHEELILNIFPTAIANAIQQQGSAKTQRYELVTVLFADIKEFTQHADLLEPEVLVEELNLYYSAFDLILEKYNVEKIKTIGDAYMAAGGVPSSNTTNPLDTVKTALAIRDFVNNTADFKRSQGQQPFEFRIGLHSGPVVAGIVGTKKFAYDIWGDTVNIAARIEQNGTIGKVNISQSTYNLLKNSTDLSFTSRGEIQTKGKGMLEMFFVETKTEL